MIQNKQVSIWRGSLTPPTLYHLWFKDEQLLLRYDDQKLEWVVFLDSSHIEDKIKDFLDTLALITINGHQLIDNPELDGLDISINIEGNYIHPGQTIDEALSTMDKLMTTKVYGL